LCAHRDSRSGRLSLVISWAGRDVFHLRPLASTPPPGSSLSAPPLGHPRTPLGHPRTPFLPQSPCLFFILSPHSSLTPRVNVRSHSHDFFVLPVTVISAYCAFPSCSALLRCRVDSLYMPSAASCLPFRTHIYTLQCIYFSLSIAQTSHPPTNLAQRSLTSYLIYKVWRHAFQVESNGLYMISPFWRTINPRALTAGFGPSHSSLPWSNVLAK
jgi:hypothetical protein